MAFVDPGDFQCFIPAGLTPPFTSHELAVVLQRPDDFAHKMTYCLRKMGTLTVVGKRQRARLYALAIRNGPAPSPPEPDPPGSAGCAAII